MFSLYFGAMSKSALKVRYDVIYLSQMIRLIVTKNYVLHNEFVILGQYTDKITIYFRLINVVYLSQLL